MMIRKTILIAALAFTMNAAAQEPTDWMDVSISVNLENSKVKRYLENTKYGYESSTALYNYMGTVTLEDDDPVPAQIPIPENTAEKLRLIYNIDNAEPAYDTVYIAADAQQYDLYNLIPDLTYTYKLEAVSGTGMEETADIISMGTIKTEGRLRMITFPMLHNCRDLGGWLTEDGHRIRYGRLFRGVELHGGRQNIADQETINGMKALGINAELDMRRTYYKEENSDFPNNIVPTVSAFGSDADYLCIQLSSTDKMLSTYKSKFRDMLKYIIRNLGDDKTVYYHCVWGADRTGLVSAIIESLLGVSLDNVYKDFELTSFSKYSGVRHKSSLNTRFLDIIGYTEDGGKTLRECTEEYVKNNLSITDEELRTLRSVMIDTDYRQNNTPTSITEIAPHPTRNGIYSVEGMKLNRSTRGLNIIIDGEGHVRKVLKTL